MESEKTRQCASSRKARKTALRRLAALLILVLAAAPRGTGRPNAAAMLRAAAESGMAVHAFYISANRAVPLFEAASIAKGAQRCLAGVQDARVTWSPSANGAVVSLAMTTEPTAWAAAEALHRAESALGLDADVKICLTGKVVPTETAEQAQALLRALTGEAQPLGGVTQAAYASFTGEHAQAAIRRNGDAYIAVPLIPLDY